jgi:hypothetical protein
MKLAEIVEHLSPQKIAGSKKVGVDLKLYLGDKKLSFADDKFDSSDEQAEAPDTIVKP